MNKDSIIALLSDIEQSGHERLAQLRGRRELERANPHTHFSYVDGRQPAEETRGELSNRFARTRGEVIPQYLKLLQSRNGVTGVELDTISDAIAKLLHRFALESRQKESAIANTLWRHSTIRLGSRIIGSEDLCRMALEFAKAPTTVAQIQGVLEEIDRTRQQEQEIERLSKLFPDEHAPDELPPDQNHDSVLNRRLLRRTSVALLTLGIAYTLFTWIPIWQAERAGEKYVEVEQIARHQRTVLKVSNQQWRYLDELGVLINERGFTPVTEQGVIDVLQWTKTNQPDWKALRLKSERKIGVLWFLLCPVILLLWFR
jgi:hypothetical protein